MIGIDPAVIGHTMIVLGRYLAVAAILGILISLPLLAWEHRRLNGALDAHGRSCYPTSIEKESQ